ncbi:MAG: PIN domain-containing protein [Firmicutes bacterium]|nr:PIN domain-containing protein [Bacillota bacterium]
MKYAFDTNTVICLLQDDPLVLQRFNAAVERGDDFTIPPLVHYEMRRGFLCKSAPKRENSYRLLTEQYPVGKMSTEVLEKGASVYATLYRARLTVDDADLLIAAFCMVGGYTLVTNNTRHFKVIDGLNIEDWTKT